MIEHMHTPVPNCLGCGSAVFAEKELGTLKVKPDDVTVCLRCGTILIFNEDLSLRQASADDVQNLELDSDTWGFISKLRDLIALRLNSRSDNLE